MKPVEKIIESIIVNSRWLMAPFYVGLILALVILLFRFVAELFEYLSHLGSLTESAAILGALTLIDISLTGNLVLIVLFSGYQSFVSRLDVASHEDWPAWMGEIDYSGLKVKLMASVVAISAVALLHLYLRMFQGEQIDDRELSWMLALHLSFVVSALLLAVTDWVLARTKH